MHRRTDAEAMPTPARRCAAFFRIAGRALDAARRAGRSPEHRSHRAVSYRLPRVRPTERRHHKGPVDGTRGVRRCGGDLHDLGSSRLLFRSFGQRASQVVILDLGLAIGTAVTGKVTPQACPALRTELVLAGSPGRTGNTSLPSLHGPGRA